MIERRTLLLLLGCLVCAAVIAAEFGGGRDAGAGLEQRPALADPVAVAPPPLRPAVDQRIAAALARPPFSPTRRPPAKSGPVAEDLADRRLTGIVILPERRLAIFAVTGAKPVALTEGGIVNGWQIETITPHDVSLRGPTGTRTLQPKLDPTFVFHQQSPPFTIAGTARRSATAAGAAAPRAFHRPTRAARGRGVARTGHDR